MKKTLKRIVFALIALVVVVFIGMVATGITPIGFGMHEPISNVDEAAIGGYDPVAYFTAGKATKGETQFTTNWKDVNWNFSSQENLDLFKASPEKYAPQFGGHCGFAVSTGFAVDGDPTSFLIQNEKLYILSGDEVKTEFVNGGADLIKSCEENWK